jgi:hypothetical protein
MQKVSSSITDYVIDTNLPAAPWTAVDSASNRNKYQEYFRGVNAALCAADNLTTFMCLIYLHLVASTSRKPQEPSRLLHGLLDLGVFSKCIYIYMYVLWRLLMALDLTFEYPTDTPSLEGICDRTKNIIF